MLDVNFVRENMEAIESKIKERQLSVDLSDFIQLDGDRRRVLLEAEKLRRVRNQTSQEIAELKRDNRDPSKKIQEMRKVARRLKSFNEQIRELNKSIEKILFTLPNIPHSSVPSGVGEGDNVEIKRVGIIPEFSFEAKAHWELGEQLKSLHFDRAAKMTGSRFSVLTGILAHLERALINFMLDIHTQEHGYSEVSPPLLMNYASMWGTGQIPHHEKDIFSLGNSDYYLLTTGEVPLTNLYREESIEEAQLPLSFVACTPCFRREAGSWGKDTRGLIRQHQFYKVQMVKHVRPEDSYDELEVLVSDAERILQLLGLPYRIMMLCTADLSYNATKCYDLEVWVPSQQQYREVSTCCNLEDFQSRRSDIRYQPVDSSKKEFVHTVSGSGLAIGRTMIALLENFQNDDGSVTVPEVLRPYLKNAITLR